MPSLTRSRLTDLGILLSLLLGGALTAYGWLTADSGALGTSPHLKLVGWLLVPMALLMVGWRLNTLATGLVMAVIIGVATNFLGAMLAVVLIAWSATTVGRLLLARFATATEMECLLVGLTIYGTIVSLLVQWPINYPVVYLTMLGAPLLIGRQFARTSAKQAWHLARTRNTDPVLQRLLGGAIVAIASVHVLVALMPEIGHDALATHLFLPARISWRHVWEFDVSRYVWCVMPMIGDWLYTTAHMLAGEAAARLLNVGCVLLLARLIFDLARWIGSNRLGGFVAVAIYLSTPLTLKESSTLLIESIWSCLILGGTLSLIHACSRRHASVHGPGETREPRHLVVAGILLGGALAAKAVSMTILPVLALVMLCRFRSWMRRDLLIAMAVGLVAFTAIGCVPYARAFLITGNPVFPFFNALFESPDYPLQNFSPSRFEKGTTWDVLYRMTFESWRYLEAQAGAAGFQWLLLVIPVTVASVFSRHRRALLIILISVVIAWLTFRQTAYLRYIFPSFAMMAAAIGAGVGGMIKPGKTTQALLAAAILAAIALNLARFSCTGQSTVIDLPALLSQQHREEYIRKIQPMRAVMTVLNALNIEHRPVAFLSPSLPAGLHSDALMASWYNHSFSSQIRAATSTDEAGQILAELGVSHLVLGDNWGSDKLRSFLRGASTEVQRIGNLSIRALAASYRYQTELLSNPTFVSGEGVSGEGWKFTGAAQVQPGGGVTVTVNANSLQQVPVMAAGIYKLSAQVRSASADATGSARLQLTWLDADSGQLATEIKVVPCVMEPQLHSVIFVAPAAAHFAMVRATGHSATPVIFDSISFRH
ncbi:MAG: hypothetical protein ACJAUC_001273 [Planctomycetota bacterium]